MALSLAKQIERNAELLRKLDWDKPDQTITESEYSKAVGDPEMIKTLTGKSVSSWDEFKTSFISHQKDLGFNWTRTRGRAGPVTLEEIVLPSELGSELAELELNRGTTEGTLDELVTQQLPKLHDYLGQAATLLDISLVRQGFKEYEKNNQSFKFSRGRSSLRFSLSIQEYNYRGQDTRKHETALGDAITERLRQALDLDTLSHTQSTRDGRKLENADFEGFKIQRHVEGDRFLMYSFELKATNGIRGISEAISQAVNYKGRSHFTYIIVPLFDQYTFHDTERLDDLIEICRTNGIGAISIDLDPNSHDVKDVTEVLTAPETRLDNSDRLSQLVSASNWELCPLCRRIVNKQNRARCGWLIQDSHGEAKCMKETMEERFTQ